MICSVAVWTPEWMGIRARRWNHVINIWIYVTIYLFGCIWKRNSSVASRCANIVVVRTSQKLWICVLWSLPRTLRSARLRKFVRKPHQTHPLYYSTCAIDVPGAPESDIIISKGSRFTTLRMYMPYIVRNVSVHVIWLWHFARDEYDDARQHHIEDRLIMYGVIVRALIKLARNN